MAELFWSIQILKDLKEKIFSTNTLLSSSPALKRAHMDEIK
jgi:hypothetical protein